MKILYYDCFAGISGDMNLGALVDLGVDPEYLTTELEKLNIKGFKLKFEKKTRQGILGTLATVVVKNKDNEKHRHLRHIHEIINQSELSEQVKSTALKIFQIIAEAEAKVHNIDIQKVHFHEVGALDSIADIVGAAICIDYLKVDRIISSPIQLGGGMVKCAHGIMPVPAPATANIVENIPVKTGLVQHEATTPTGAAILVAVADSFSSDVSLPISKIGYGIGQRDISDVPNILRVFLLEDNVAPSDVQTTENIRLECNIDDMASEHFEYVLDKLFEHGAKDAWITPIIMKKSRPAHTLSVLCDLENVATLKNTLFTHTTTLGIREEKVNKNWLHREEETIDTAYGKVRIKKSFLDGKLLRYKAEYEDRKALAAKNNISLFEIDKAIQKTLSNGN